MFQVVLSLLLAFQKLLILAVEKKLKNAALRPGTVAESITQLTHAHTYNYTATATARVTPHMHSTCTSYVLYA